MKTLTEKYLFLLTEDPELDNLNAEYKKVRDDVKKYSQGGAEGPEALSSKYANTPKNQIPKNHQRIIDNYRDAVSKFDEVSKKRSNYAQWVRDGMKGPKPGSGPRPDSGFYYQRQRRQSGFHYDFNSGPEAEEFRRASERARERYAQSVKAARKINRRITAAYVVLIILMIALRIYLAYLDEAREKARKAKLKGKQKEIFLLKSKIVALNERIKNLEKQKIKCSKSDNPRECINKIDEEIKKLRIRLIKAKNRLKELTKK
jgi:hypothetical protein